ncbi:MULTISPECIES: HDOD domain-containing protein [unclassified Nitrospina]|uniref:HDOD domain-containing protein n=1 Tax=unclassified Nitrospina TaxID=2638683 RepID=UPI003F96ABE9
MREHILEIIQEKKNIPPLPDILHRLEAKIGSPKSQVSDIAILIETEPILSGRLIQLSNSVFFGGTGCKVEKLPDAIIRLGLKMILDLAYTLELPKLFLRESALNQKKFWQHSLAVAILARLLAENLKPLNCDPDPCYLSGLMHDIGIMVFSFVIPKEYGQFLKDVRGINQPLHALEQKRFGIAHPELGAEFIRKWWPIPSNVVLAVEKHFLQVSEKGKKFPTLLSVIMANDIANHFGMDHNISAYKEELDRGFLQSYGLTPAMLDEMIDKTRDSLHMAQEVLYK